MRLPIALIVLVCATLLSSHPALAQFSQQGPKLEGGAGALGPTFAKTLPCLPLLTATLSPGQ
jgi:hypothetical protein